ncbi:MAG: HAMP domain-containing histidine kinase [Muribaculaceae bacterium]|nr:HAMP domain-containing histidine kinase [Muribaculaceae bacterium]
MTFNYDIPTYCRVVGNCDLLLAMINNLAKNAAAYSKGTECNLILTDKDDEYFHFAFYDNGVGVKEASLPHLFERFFREDSGRSRKKGGTGLGLCIVQNTIEALGGTITASNREGGGLLFRFTLKRYIRKA